MLFQPSSTTSTSSSCSKILVPIASNNRKIIGGLKNKTKSIGTKVKLSRAVRGQRKERTKKIPTLPPGAMVSSTYLTIVVYNRAHGAR